MSKTRKVAGVAALITAALVVMPVDAGIGKSEPAPLLAAPVPEAAAELVAPPKSRAEAAQHRPEARPMSVGVSAELRAVADRHMTTDPSLREMLQGTAYKVVKEGPWTRMKSSARIGVVRELQLTDAVDMPMRGWPVIYWDEARDTYDRHSYNSSWSNVTKVAVFIDDAAGVVALTPDEKAVLKEGPGNDWIKSLPKGTPK